ncbi:MAG TPA: hypothetical protein P5081_10160 [Phycisphaerae bacterium]|nr:hypothetical protein [Phycisphaerae bacterium]HRW53242.1 hypothetical protein [Phycisphaerae bacterium]
MSHRIWGITITLAWLVMLGILVRDDILPYLLAQDPPAATIPDGNFQTAIFKDGGNRIGTSWVTTISPAESTTVHGITLLDVSGILPVAGIVPVRTIRLESTLSYNLNDKLDQFSFVLDTEGASARIDGERYDQEFACVAKIGEIKRRIALDASLTAYLSDTFRPFTLLKGLKVGQSWRMRVIDPFALLQSQETKFDVRLVRVTRREKIKHRGAEIECFRVETDQTVAWADDDGHVLRQEVTMPFLGRWIMIDEPFDAHARQNAKRDLVELRHADNSGLKNAASRLIDEAKNAASSIDTILHSEATDSAQDHD